MKSKCERINIIGAGLSGLFAAKTLACEGYPVRLFSTHESGRAQSNLAQGGINAALDLMGENDSISEHYDDTMRGGLYLASPAMVKGLTESAPDIVMELDRLGAAFHRENGRIVQRAFGGQKKRRTVYAKSSTGRLVTLALTDEVRRYEATGLVERFPHHLFRGLLLDKDSCLGVRIYDTYTGATGDYPGVTIIATGGLNGLFYGMTTGTTANTGSAAAMLFLQGVRFANLEFIQYHPTTIKITGKRLLVSEAARGEGARLFVYDDNDKPFYFMEEKYGERGNLMPRDVVSRQMHLTGRDVYLDFGNISDEVWTKRLSDMRDEVIHYTGIDPKEEALPVSPGIHYFMGGIYINEAHATGIKGLFAAGECAAGYHGANRLGGNSMLAAIYGGKKAAISAMGCCGEEKSDDPMPTDISFLREDESELSLRISAILSKGMSIVRSSGSIEDAINELEGLGSYEMSDELHARFELSRAILKSALYRRESRGAHVRSDFPDTKDEFKKTTVAHYSEGNVNITFEEVDKPG